MVYPNENEARTMICEYGRRMYALGFVAGNEGNISCRVGENEVWVTPTMESKGYMTPDMLIKLDLDGNRLEGELLPSSETLMHLGLYKASSGIAAVVHAHPPVATAFSCLGKNVPTTSLTEAVYLFGTELIVTPYAIPGTSGVPDSVRPYANKCRALLLGNHGALTWAKTLKEAWFTMEILEQYLKTYLISEKLLGGPSALPSAAVEMLLPTYEKSF